MCLPSAMRMPAQPAPRRLGVLAPFARPTLGELLAVLQEGLRAPAQRVAGVNVLASPFLHGLRALIIDLALRARLPTTFQWPETAREGGLLGYGPSNAAMFRQLAGYVVRMLRGARPSELPIEQPKKTELAVKLSTARAIGITVPRTLPLRATEVVECRGGRRSIALRSRRCPLARGHRLRSRPGRGSDPSAHLVG